ncbi:UNKNOWN [Stylonychia lemnae]|uniref:Uncharacterized protein n=1 Tax=Stylonychia lemnae TaxID=5949 RepID=A0A078AUH6_STYLE|nr:UNKNOWN [Stylonychia lemnae]|eukprot:CDW85869.1 UNKNOWN [Stylonychia lemnae]
MSRNRNRIPADRIQGIQTLELEQRPDLAQDEYLDKPLNSQKDEYRGHHYSTLAPPLLSTSKSKLISQIARGGYNDLETPLEGRHSEFNISSIPQSALLHHPQKLALKKKILPSTTGKDMQFYSNNLNKSDYVDNINLSNKNDQSFSKFAKHHSLNKTVITTQEHDTRNGKSIIGNQTTKSSFHKMNLLPKLNKSSRTRDNFNTSKKRISHNVVVDEQTESFMSNGLDIKQKVSLNGIDNSIENVTELVHSALEALQLDINKRPLETEDIGRLCSQFGLQLSPFQQYEALFYARKSSQEASKFSLVLLITWLSKHLPILRPVNRNLNKSVLNQTSSQDFDDFGKSMTRRNFNNSFMQRGDNQYRSVGRNQINPYASMFSGDTNLQSRTIYADQDFKQQVQQTVKLLQKLPTLKKTIQSKMMKWQDDREEDAAKQGIEGAVKARMDIKAFYRRKEEEREALLKKFLENEPNACHASNLYRLLTKRWTEEPNAYKVCSKLTPKKQKRIRDILLENRYN